MCNMALNTGKSRTSYMHFIVDLACSALYEILRLFLKMQESESGCRSPSCGDQKQKKALSMQEINGHWTKKSPSSEFTH